MSYTGMLTAVKFGGKDEIVYFKKDLIVIKLEIGFVKLALGFVHIARRLRGKTWSKS